MKINDLKEVSELQRQNGSFNIILSFLLVIAGIMLGYIIYQNSISLEKISKTQLAIADQLTDSKNTITILTSKLISIEDKLNLIFLEKFDVKKK